MPNSFQIGPLVFDKRIFKAFPYGCQNSKCNFESGPSNDHSSEVLWHSIKWFMRCLKEQMMDIQ